MPEYKQLPATGKATGAELTTVIDSRIRYDWMTGPAGYYSMWRQGELFDQGEQWIRKAFSAGSSGAPWQWVPESYVQNPNDPSSLPMPVFNEGVAARMNETARLSRPKYMPQVRANQDNPDAVTRLACNRMTKALLSELDRMRWTTEADVGHYRLPVHGSWFLKSWWEQRWDETVMVPVKGSMACPRHPKLPGGVPGEQSCDFTTASPMMPADKARGLIGGVPDDAKDVAVDFCPQCADRPDLVKFNVTQEEAGQGVKDKVGRPMGQPEPKGQWMLGTRSPYDIFLPNMGIGVRYDSIPSIVECHVETLDWLALHFPEHAHEVKPESASALMEYHPIGGSPLMYGGGAEGHIFDNSVRVKEIYEKPRMVWDEDRRVFALDKGRAVTVAGGVKLLDADYLMESLTHPGEYVERAVYELIPWDLRDGANIAYGLGLWELMISPSETINDIASQTAAHRERGAIAYVWTPKDSNLEMAEREGIPFSVIETSWSPEDGEHGKPSLLGNTTIADGVYKERDYASSFLNNVSGRSEVEQGHVPPGVSAATAINILREESGTTRATRIDRIKAAVKRGYSHGARLISAFWVEPRAFRYEENNRERWDRATGLDFLGQTDVTLEPEPEFDSEDQKREAVRDFIQLKIDTTTPQGRTMARLVGAPPELFDAENRQELNADREWLNFLTKDKRPIMDPTLDDPGEHWKCHGERCDDERFLDLEEKANWDGALAILAGAWDQDIQGAASEPPPPLPTDMIAVDSGEVDPMTGAPVVTQVPYADAVAQGLIQQAPPPESLEVRIEKKWMARLTAFQFAPKDPEAAKALAKVMMWRSHAEAHRIYGEMKQAAAQAGPVMASPGAPQTDAGTEVTPQTPQASIAQPASPGVQ